jgi:Ser/Thr protein kinase RdoA (MazF antagonist)
MSAISLDEKKGVLQVLSYDGSSAKEESTSLSCFSEKSVTANPLEFFRTGSNHSYSNGGRVSYDGDCNNNLVISFYNQNKLINVRNAFILAGDSHIKIMPVFGLQEVISKGRRILSGKRINYHIPERVLKKENLPKLNLDKLIEEIEEGYKIRPRKVLRIPAGRSKRGVYHVIGENGQEYIFKYRGENKMQAELISTVLSKVQTFFPKIYSREDGSGYTSVIEGRLYGLEDYVHGSSRERNLDYFSLLGSHIALLHEQLSHFAQENKSAGRMLSERAEHFNESSIASVYLDLAKNDEEHCILLSELDKIIDEEVTSKVRSLPNFLVHRDLNHSNIVWMGDNLKIIDSESLGVAERVIEFVPALLLQGNRNRPNYVRGSLQEIVNAYSKSNNLSNEEIALLPGLLKFSLIRYYVVRNIRRKIGEEGELDKLKKDLNQID